MCAFGSSSDDLDYGWPWNAWNDSDLDFTLEIPVADVPLISPYFEGPETPEALYGFMLFDDPVIFASASSESEENIEAQAVVIETETSLTPEGQDTEAPPTPTRKRSFDEITGKSGKKSSPAKPNKGGIYDAYERVMANPTGSVDELLGDAADKNYGGKLRKNIEWLFFLELCGVISHNIW